MMSHTFATANDSLVSQLGMLVDEERVRARRRPQARGCHRTLVLRCALVHRKGSSEKFEVNTLLSKHATNETLVQYAATPPASISRHRRSSCARKVYLLAFREVRASAEAACELMGLRELVSLCTRTHANAHTRTYTHWRRRSKDLHCIFQRVQCAPYASHGCKCWCVYPVACAASLRLRMMTVGKWVCGCGCMREHV